ncbi:MAG: lipoate--protein ligase [Gudongella sp.]|jgi:lipoate-protein ligase A|nr:lipoate--protein ligase [Gudongella sp.]
MKYITNLSNDPHYNLAFEEYCFKNLPEGEDYVFLWINGPSIIVGKNQNTIEEINQEFVRENGIKVVRRITGGGAVYHDHGNLNFSIFTKSSGKEKIDFGQINIPILKSLERFGIQAELSGRNDLTVDEKKVSGIAQSVWKGRILNHGTILYDTDLTVLSKALNVKADKYESKGVKSVRSRVTNIKPYMVKDVDILQFKGLLLNYIFEYAGSAPEEYILSEEQLQGIEKLFQEKYSTWDWNYGESPDFGIKNYKKFPIGSIDVRLQVKNGVISDIRIFGDFFGTKDVRELEDRVKGMRYEREELENLLKEVEIANYFGTIDNGEFLNLIFE